MTVWEASLRDAIDSNWTYTAVMRCYPSKRYKIIVIYVLQRPVETAKRLIPSRSIPLGRPNLRDVVLSGRKRKAYKFLNTIRPNFYRKTRFILPPIGWSSWQVVQLPGIVYHRKTLVAVAEDASWITPHTSVSFVAFCTKDMSLSERLRLHSVFQRRPNQIWKLPMVVDLASSPLNFNNWIE